MTKKPIKRPGDLAPRGIRSTYGVKHDFNETFKHIFNEARRPDPSWQNFKYDKF